MSKMNKITVKYRLTKKGQKAELLAGRTGEQSRQIEIEVDAELMSVVQIDKTGRLYVNYNDTDKIIRLYKGIETEWSGGRKICHAALTDAYYFKYSDAQDDQYLWFDKIPTTEEITEKLKNMMLETRYSKFVEAAQKEYDDKIEAERCEKIRQEAEQKKQAEFARQEKINEMITKLDAGKLFERNEKGQIVKM